MAKPSGIREVDLSRMNWSLMVYADPGIGKTYLAGTGAKEDHDTLVIRSPVDHTETLAIHFPDVVIDEVVLKDWDEADDIHEYLRHEDHGYRWVWLDTMSLIQDVGLDSIMEDLVAAKPSRNLYVPDRGEYGENMNRIRRYVKLMSALDFNLGMTAHVFLYEFPTSGEIKRMPWIQGKQMPEKICAYANVVGFLDLVEHDEHGKVRILHLEGGEEHYAKDGFGAFDSGRLINPTIPKMEQAVTNAKKKESKKNRTKKSTRTRKNTEEDFTF